MNLPAHKYGMRPRLVCTDGVSLSVQASAMHYCAPRNNDGPHTHVEVGFLLDADNQPFPAPVTWARYDDGTSDVFGYVPVELVESFIADHGGVKP